MNRRQVAKDTAHTTHHVHALVNKRQGATNTAPGTRRARTPVEKRQGAHNTAHGTHQARLPVKKHQVAACPKHGQFWRESGQPQTPLTQARVGPQWAPQCRSHGVQSQLARACAVGLVTGSNARPTPPPTGKGQQAPAACPKEQLLVERDCPTQDTPHRGTRRPCRAPLCRPHSAQSQLARVCTVGLVTGPLVRTLSAQRKRAAVPDHLLQGRAGRAGRVPNPERP